MKHILSFILFLFLFTGPAKSDPMLEQRIAEHLDASWPVQSVLINDETLTVTTGLRRINQTAYTYMVAATCLILVENQGAEKQFTEFVFLNLFGAQGWVFEKPAVCNEVIRAAGDELLVAAHSHLY